MTQGHRVCSCGEEDICVGVQAEDVPGGQAVLSGEWQNEKLRAFPRRPCESWVRGCGGGGVAQNSRVCWRWGILRIRMKYLKVRCVRPPPWWFEQGKTLRGHRVLPVIMEWGAGSWSFPQGPGEE